jgi:hypothetical protein
LAATNSNPKTARLHAMSWFPADWRSSRVRMRSALSGDPWLRVVYRELLDSLWEHGGSVPDDAEWLADDLAIPAEHITQALPTLVSIGSIVRDGGTLRNERISSGIADAIEYKKTKSEAGKIGRGSQLAAGSRRAVAGQSPGMPVQTLAGAGLPTPTPTPTPKEIPPFPPLQGGFDLEPVGPTGTKPRAKKPKAVPLVPAAGFEEFWASYPKKEAKQDAIAVWNGMTPADREAATRAAPRYAAAMAGKERDYIKFPQGWLNARRFEDEVAPAVQAPPPPLTEKQKWEKRKDAEAAQFEKLKEIEKLQWRDIYRQTLPSMEPRKRAGIMADLLTDDPEFAAEMAAKGC